LPNPSTFLPHPEPFLLAVMSTKLRPIAPSHACQPQVQQLFCKQCDFLSAVCFYTPHDATAYENGF